jgi:hypothetical protein
LTKQDENGVIDEIVVVVESRGIARAKRVNAIVLGNISELLRRASEAENGRMKLGQIPPQLRDRVALRINRDKERLQRDIAVVLRTMHERGHALELSRTDVWTVGVSKVDQTPLILVQLAAGDWGAVARFHESERALTDLCDTFALLFESCAIRFALLLHRHPSLAMETQNETHVRFFETPN